MRHKFPQRQKKKSLFIPGTCHAARSGNKSIGAAVLGANIYVNWLERELLFLSSVNQAKLPVCQGCVLVMCQRQVKGLFICSLMTLQRLLHNTLQASLTLLVLQTAYYGGW